MPGKTSTAEQETTESELQEAPEQERAPEAAAEGAKEDKTYKFQLLADREATWGESRYWSTFAIGHSWIRLLKPDGSHDSWGYWPDIWGGHAVNPSRPWQSVQGKVLHPDEQHSPNALQTTAISEEQAKKVEDAANAKEASPGMYNLFTYNCTTFAADMARLAGAPVPSFSTLGIANPNSLFSGIEAANQERGLTPMETPLPPDGGDGN
jgi:hypothetical protein